MAVGLEKTRTVPLPEYITITVTIFPFSIRLDTVPALSASAVVIHYEEALYQVYAPLPLLVDRQTDRQNW